MWKNKFHISAEKGLINDPNGLIYWKGEYHIFYQFNPYKCEHASKHWGHVKSKDLVNWEKLPIALIPRERYDKDGCYSGSAIEKDGKLYLIYTGNIKNNGIRESYQCLAVSDDGINFKKLGVVIDNKEIPKGYTRHFRDPKIFKKNNKFYIVIGAQREDLTGTILLFSSNDLLKWEFKKEILRGDFGFMCECPDFYEIEKNKILVFSPQGLKPQENLYNNRYQSGYILRDIYDIEKNNFIELDRGFEFYAPQSFEGKEKERIMIGWLGMPEELDHPSVDEGWIHSLTLPRVITIKNNKLYQTPHKNLKLLRKNKILLENIKLNKVLDLKDFNIFGKTFEIILEFENLKEDFLIRLYDNKETGLILKYDNQKKLFIMDRENFKEGYKGIRKCYLNSLSKLQIFSDRNCIEIFINDGEEVFTGNIYPEEEGKNICILGNDIFIKKIEFYEI